MKEIRTNGFTGKDIFNASASTPLKDIVGVHIDVTDVYVTTKDDDTTVAYLKAADGTIYGTISQSIIGQITGLAELLPTTIVAVSKRSNAGRDYLMLELV